MTHVAVLAADQSQSVGLTPRDSLTLLLTTESLIFAAFSITATLALPTDTGRSLFYAQGRFAGLVVVLLAILAAASLSALRCTLEPDPPHGISEWFRAVAIGLAIVAQPILALLVARAATKTRPSFKAEE